MPPDAATPPSRRDLIRAALAAPAVYGLAALLACRARDDEAARPRPPQDVGPSPSPPSGWASWRHAVAQEGRPGLVVRIPRTAAARTALGEALVDLVDRGTPAQQLFFADAAVACLSDAQLADLLPSVAPSDDLALVDAAFARVDGASWPASGPGDRALVAAALARLVDGADGARLAARAAAARARLAPDRADAYDALRTPVTPVEPRTIAWDVADVAPMLRHELAGSPAPARRAALEGAIADALANRLFGGGHTAMRLPEGVATSSEGGGCGGRTADGHVVACGMALPTPGSYRFVKFLADGGA